MCYSLCSKLFANFAVCQTAERLAREAEKSENGIFIVFLL